MRNLKTWFKIINNKIKTKKGHTFGGFLTGVIYWLIFSLNQENILITLIFSSWIILFNTFLWWIFARILYPTPSEEQAQTLE